MANEYKNFRVEIIHESEGLICSFPFAVLKDARQLFDYLVKEHHEPVYSIQLWNAQNDMLLSWPQEN